MIQPTLFPLADLPAPAQTPQERFRTFHEANPHVYVELRDLALRLLGQGHRHYSIAGLFEVVRFRHAVQTVGDDYKLNNTMKPRYARLLMANEPALDVFFETRTAAADKEGS